MRRAVVSWGAAALTLGAGYVLLALGESTVSAVLLFVAYIALVPAAIRLGTSRV